MGLTLLNYGEDKVYVALAEGDSLEKLKDRFIQYGGLTPDGNNYDILSCIESIGPLEKEDRTGFVLKQNPLKDGEINYFDVELWYTGKPALRQVINQIRQELPVSSQASRITDDWTGDTISLMRARLDQTGLDILLNMDAVREVERIPEPIHRLSDFTGFSVNELTPPSADDMNRDDPAILVLDSGVISKHPYIEPYILGAESVLDGKGSEDEYGHGTSVIGLAIYGPMEGRIQSADFGEGIPVVSVRILDEQGAFDQEKLLEGQLENAIANSLANHPTIKVINLSIGNADHPYRPGQKQYRLAALVDELAYKYRDQEILFVISSGNDLPDLSDEEIRSQYPDYLHSTQYNRILDPASSALSLTVGALASGTMDYDDGRVKEHVIGGVAGQRDYPAPYTCGGPGVHKSIKPDLVENSGDLPFERGKIPRKKDKVVLPRFAGIVAPSAKFAPPEGRLFEMVTGTSFSAPVVSHYAARLWREFPGASSNLIRALLADSARIPDSRPESLSRKDIDEPEILYTYGYGKLNYDRARYSADDRVLLLVDEIIEVDTFEIFRIPPLPQEFLEKASRKQKGYLSVTLAFDPPTRHRRGDSYTGINMEYSMFRNCSLEELSNAIKAWDRDQDEHFENALIHKNLGLLNKSKGKGIPIKVGMKPGTEKRETGTLQKSIARVSSKTWAYSSGNELLLAVICQRKWAPEEIKNQRFAVVVSIFHDAPQIDLYSRIALHTQVYTKTRMQQRQRGRV